MNVLHGAGAATGGDQRHFVTALMTDTAELAPVAARTVTVTAAVTAAVTVIVTVAVTGVVANRPARG